MRPWLWWAVCVWASLTEPRLVDGPVEEGWRYCLKQKEIEVLEK